MPRSLILFLILSIGIVSSSDILNYTVETEESLGCSQINRHKRFYYEIPENSTIRLPTCRPFQSNSVVFWFSYDEYCRNSFNRNRHFASVFPNGTNLCENQNECRENFRFTSESMIILKTNKQSITQYVCSLNRLTSSSDRPVSYLIRFVIDNDQSSTKPEESTTHDNFSASTYFSSTTISIGSNTVDLSTAEISSKSRLLIIVISASVVVLLIITSIIGTGIGYIYYRRRRVRQEQEAMQMECLK